MTTTIQQTAKRWKIRQFSGLVLFLVGAMVLVALAGWDTGELVGSWLAVGGLGLYIWGRIGAWWDHG